MPHPGALLFLFLGGIAVVFVLLSSNPSDGRPAGMSDDDISRAALKIVMPLPDCSKSWIGGTVERCDDALTEVAKRRQQYATFEPAWMRAAMLHWMDFAEGQIREARKDCETQASRKDQEEYRKRTQDEDRRARDVLKSIGR